jgi:hypothetical protein
MSVVRRVLNQIDPHFIFNLNGSISIYSGTVAAPHCLIAKRTMR